MHLHPANNIFVLYKRDVLDEGAASIHGEPAEYKLLHEHVNEQHSNTWGWARGTFINAAEGETAQLNSDLPAGVKHRMQMHSEQLALYKEAAENNPKVTCPKLVYSILEKQKAKMVQINVDGHVSNYRTYFVAGGEDIDDDATYAKYLQQLKNHGLDKTLTLAQTAYDRQVKDK